MPIHDNLIREERTMESKNIMKTKAYLKKKLTLLAKQRLEGVANSKFNIGDSVKNNTNFNITHLSGEQGK